MKPLATLVVAPNWIGDALMAQPLLTLLRQADPGQRIVALAPRWVAPVLRAMPEVDDVIATDLAHGALQWRARRALAREVASSAFDRAFVLPNSFKSALIPWLAGIPRRIGYRGESRYLLLNHRIDGPDPAWSMTERYAALAGMAGIAVASPLPRPRLTVDPASIAAVRERYGFGADDDLVALCPGAEYGPAKRWPAGHFAALATTLLDERPRSHVLLLGGAGDRVASEAIVAAVLASRGAVDALAIDGAANGPAAHDVATAGARGAVDATTPDARLHDLCGRTDLAEAIALIATASSVVSNDSGLMHVAAALSRPQVALFGSSDPRHTPPLSPRATTLWLHLDCSPCFERTCPLGHLDCLVGITPQRVFDSMQNTDPSR